MIIARITEDKSKLEERIEKLEDYVKKLERLILANQEIMHNYDKELEANQKFIYEGISELIKQLSIALGPLSNASLELDKFYKELKERLK